MEYLPEPRLASFTILFGALLLAPGLTKSPARILASRDSNTHILAILAGHGPDNNVEWTGLRHDSRDLLYRTPGGAVPAGTPVTIRFRAFHNDVTSVKLRLYDLNSGSEFFHPMTPVASHVSCYQAGLENETCD